MADPDWIAPPEPDEQTLTRPRLAAIWGIVSVSGLLVVGALVAVRLWLGEGGE